MNGPRRGAVSRLMMGAERAGRHGGAGTVYIESMRIPHTVAAVVLAIAALAASGAQELAEAQSRRGSRAAVSSRSAATRRAVPTRPAAASRMGFRVTRPRSARGVPLAPEHIVRRTPVVGADGRVVLREVFLRPAPLRDAPIIEVVPGDAFGRDRTRGGDRRDRSRDPFGFHRRGPRDRGFGHPCGRGGGLRVAVGSDGVSVGVGTGRGFKHGGGHRCGFARAGGFLIGPFGTVYSGAAAYGDGYADAYDAGAGEDVYYEENASGAVFAGDDGRYPGGATGCATVIVRMRGGELYGGEVALPALGAETPEALAAALRSRHRRGRSTVLRGFEGATLGIPAGPGIEGVQVEPCV